ncbi:MAG: hypothetical protein ACI9LO_002137, partial [Planctomycetota bacterium]
MLNPKAAVHFPRWTKIASMKITASNLTPGPNESLKLSVDLLAQLKSAGTLDAQISKVVDGGLLLSTRLGDLFTNNSPGLKSGDKLQLQYTERDSKPILRATKLETQPIRINSAAFPQLNKLLPSSKPGLAKIVNETTAHIEIKFSGKLLELPRFPELVGTRLLSLQSVQHGRAIEILPVDTTQLLKSLLNNLAARPGAASVPAPTVKVLQLLASISVPVQKSISPTKPAPTAQTDLLWNGRTAAPGQKPAPGLAQPVAARPEAPPALPDPLLQDSQKCLNPIRRGRSVSDTGSPFRPLPKTGAAIPGAAIPGAVVSGAVVSGAVVSGAVVSGAVVSGAVVSGAVVSGAVVSGAVVSGAAVSGAVVSGNAPENRQQPVLIDQLLRSVFSSQESTADQLKQWLKPLNLSPTAQLPGSLSVASDILIYLGLPNHLAAAIEAFRNHLDAAGSAQAPAAEGFTNKDALLKLIQ